MEENSRALWLQIWKSLTGQNNLNFSKNPPNIIQENFSICRQKDLVDEAFEDLANIVRQHTLRPFGADPKNFERWPTWHWERGRIEPGRRYFYFKAQNLRGWLCERSGPGWVISRSEKIHDRDLFLRPFEPWDIVNLYIPTGAKDLSGSRQRFSSVSQGGALLSPQLYTQKLLDAISEDSLRIAA